jgi:hypothetical protein
MRTFSLDWTLGRYAGNATYHPYGIPGRDTNRGAERVSPRICRTD